MAAFTIGEVVIVAYPFSDGSGVKKRPALVVKINSEEDIVVCMISASPRTDIFSFPIVGTDFIDSNLLKNSFVRPESVLVVHKKLCFKVGRVSQSFTQRIKDYLADWIKA